MMFDDRYYNVTIHDLSIEDLQLPMGSRTTGCFLSFHINGHERRVSTIKQAPNPSWDGEEWKLEVKKGESIEVIAIHKGRTRD
ncbi:hypothetical protein JAAARDRAFT_585463 [Jaapia argillacea MUCL 33604]|uniref:C2 domain-containing protein n=1 Tax=Jaapia argillacea MUCL 33604 TaxID=933084 RepID=A0A067PHJ2_9AGAM|nr:hypothetical protein JAAARDRAFT_585463 [Jaapia argillacea MUCL 33604]